MQITYLGYLVIPMGILLFLLRPMYLLYGTIFFSTFTASSILNIHSSKIGIQPVYYISSLWFLYLIIEYIKKIIKEKKLIINLNLSKIRKQFLITLIIFAVIVLASIVMLIIRENTQEAILVNKKLQIIRFTFSNIARYIYLVFMLLSAISIIITIKTKKLFENCLKSFIFSTIFSAIWGILQFCMYYLHIKYPYYIFNNNIAYSQQYAQTMHGIKRINSIAVEPSMYAFHMLMAVSIILVLWLVKYTIFKNKIINDIFLNSVLLLSVLVLLLTTSTTAYLILVILIISINLYILLFNRKRCNELSKNRRRIYFFNILIAVSVIGILVFSIYIFKIHWSTLYETFKNITVNKLNVESGKIRTTAIVNALEIFRKHPILGIGWGTYRTFDLTTNILVNCGMLGLISFAAIVILPIKKLFQSLREDKENQALILGITFSILCGVLSLIISIPDLTFAYFWIILALGACIVDLKVN